MAGGRRQTGRGKRRKIKYSTYTGTFDTVCTFFFSAFPAAPSSFSPLPVAISALPVSLAPATLSGAKVRGRREQVRQCWRGAARLLGYLCLSCCHSGKERAHFVLLFSAPIRRFLFFFSCAKLLRLAATIFYEMIWSALRRRLAAFAASQTALTVPVLVNTCEEKSVFLYLKDSKLRS